METDLWITPEQARSHVERGTGRGIRVAVLDSGIEVNHPELAGMVLRDDVAVTGDGVSLSIVPGGGRDVFGHGTAVAGIVRSLAPEAEIGSVRVLGEQLKSRTAIIRAGARQAIRLGYHILNCSFGCGVLDHVLQYKDWIDEAYLHNVHVVAACNNFDSSKPEWPGYFSSVVTVNMAEVERDRLFYQPGSMVEFMARGVNVEVPWMDGQKKAVTGSSFAAAHVSGLLARLLSQAPDLAPMQVKALLRRFALPWPGCQEGRGKS